MKIDDNVLRVDAKEKISGKNKYLEDISFENLQYARTLRSSIARGVIKEINYPELPEGYYIVDYRDVHKNEVKMIETDMPVFAKDEVNYIGEPIALVVGEDKDTIIKLLNAIEVVYEEKEPIFSMEEAEAKRIRIKNNNNLYVEHNFNKGNIKKLKDCRIFEKEYKTTYQEQLYIEKQGVVGTYTDGTIVVYGSLQCPYYVKNALIHATGFEEDRLRVIQTDTGGAFGGKEEYPSLLACQVAVAALKVNAPVRLIFDRREDIMYTTKRHPSRTKIKSYIKNNKVVGMEFDISLDGGPYLGLSDVVLQRALFTLTGAYNIPNLDVTGRVFYTNNVFTGAFRGFGAPQSMFALEQHMNQIARILKMDPMRFKENHFVKQGDTTATNGVYIEEIKLEELIEKLKEISDYNYKKNTEDSEEAYYGIGCSVIPHGGGFTGDGEATHIKAKVKLKKNRDGTVEILIANVDMGQGAKTALSKIVASALDLSLADIIYKNPDTKFVPDSGPTVASRTTMVVGQLLYKAAKRMKKRWLEKEFIIEENFEAPDYLVWDQETLQGNAYMSYSWSGVVAEVRVDKVTYDVVVEKLYGVYDIGYPIDQLLVQGQIHGGMIQGMGLALFENMISQEGKIQQNNFEAYSVPTSLDIPEMSHELIINKYEDGPFGAKGLGELTLVGVPPAIASAIEDAVEEDIYELPVIPERIMEVVSYED